MKKNYLLNSAASIICLVPVIYLIMVYPSLPLTVAVHFNLEGNPNRYGNKSELLTTICLLSGVSIAIFFLFKYLPKIDPKKTAQYSQQTFKKIGMGLIILFAMVNLSIIYSAVTGALRFTKLYLPFISLFFAFIGNMMNSIKPNYFAGIRTPWALENEDNWRETHRLASKLFFGGGIVMAIVTFLLPFKIGFIVFIACTIIITVIPFVYSYQYFKNHKQL